VVQLPSRHGWVSLHAASDRTAGDVIIVIQPAVPATVMPILARAYGLTPMQRRVTILVMQGLAGKQISSQLQISTDTVRDHLEAIYRKTGVSSHGGLRHRLALDVWTTPTDGAAI
jgi:DNA-binding CsgD family transcriptional regulator